MAMEEIAGYAVRRVLGSGSVGTAYLVRDLASGRPVVLKRVPASFVPPGEGLALARGLDHPHLARLLDARQADGEWLVVSEYVAAGSLTELLQRRGPLSCAELVTLVAPIAQALAVAHRAGLAHGHLGPGDIRFTPDGRPVLTDLGLHRGEAVADLVGLRELALLAGGDPELFGPELFAGDAEAVARRVLELAVPEPVDLGFGELPGGSGEPGRAVRRTGSSRVRRRSPAQGRRRVAVAVLACAAVLSVGLLSFGSILLSRGEAPTATPVASSPTSSAVPTSSPTRASRASVGWLRLLQGLDARRAEVFATLDPMGLDAIYVPGSAPWQADRAMLASYRDQRMRIDGLELRIEQVTVEREQPGTVVLRVVDRLVAGAALDRDGRRTVLPAGTPMTRLITLTGEGERWRISHIVSA